MNYTQNRLKTFNCSATIETGYKLNGYDEQLPFNDPFTESSYEENRKERHQNWIIQLNDM